jgi:cephalosporin hydroxylase
MILPQVITIDNRNGKLLLQTPDGRQEIDLYSPEAFNVLSEQWVRVGWVEKYSYTFTWMGRPIIQLPEDIIRMQELVYTLKPDVIIETGVAHGGSLIYYASLCKLIGKGRVIGVDIEIRPHNRSAIETHTLANYITLIEGDSIAPEVTKRIAETVGAGETVLVILDSKHCKSHVQAELEAYSPLVSVGSYIIAMDGVMESVAGLPRTKSTWSCDNPKEAALEFVARNRNFVIAEPPLVFNQSPLSERVTYSPSGFIQRRS